MQEMKKMFTRWNAPSRKLLTIALLTAGVYASHAQAPVNDECTGAIDLSTGTMLIGESTVNTTPSLPGFDCFGDPIPNDMWYKVTSGSSGTAITITVDAGFGFASPRMQYFNGSCGGTLTSVDCGVTSLTIAATPNTTYYFRVYELFGGSMLFDIQATGDMVLPVTMGKLSARATGNNTALLQWNTLTEQHNLGFSVERATDGNNFRPAGFVQTQAKGGNSTTELNYSFMDNNVPSGTVYYRLVQTDIDGKTTVSGIAKVNNGKLAETKIKTYPNPVTDQLSISSNGAMNPAAVISLVDMMGKTVWSKPASAAVSGINMSSFASGVYWLKYADANETSVQQIIKK
jgi:hypothetical protein